METFYFDKTKEIKRCQEELEKKLNVKITVAGKKVTIDGTAIDEYEAEIVLSALGFGFSIKQALLLKNEDFIFKKINIKEFTRRKDMYEVRARAIGSEGKTKRTIESVSDSDIIINGNEIGIIAHANNIDATVTAIKNIVRGSKQANVYNYLERMNAERKKHPDDLGLKDEKK